MSNEYMTPGMNFEIIHAFNVDWDYLLFVSTPKMISSNGSYKTLPISDYAEKRICRVYKNKTGVVFLDKV